MAVKKEDLIQLRDVSRTRGKLAPSLLSQSCLDEINLIAKALGFIDVQPLQTSEIVTASWVGLKCRYGCANYNTSWCCPPASPDLQTTRELLQRTICAFC